MTQQVTSDEYAKNIATQMRKGFLTYCVLRICREAMYTSDVIERLRNAELIVVEGTIYPLLSKLQKDGLLQHEWQESKQGAPRKYYKTTDYGSDVLTKVSSNITALNTTLKKL